MTPKNTCDHEHDTNLEIRALPYGSPDQGGNILCCHFHYRQEMQYRGESTPRWEDLKIYSARVWSDL